MWFIVVRDGLVLSPAPLVIKGTLDRPNSGGTQIIEFLFRTRLADPCPAQEGWSSTREVLNEIWRVVTVSSVMAFDPSSEYPPCLG